MWVCCGFGLGLVWVWCGLGVGLVALKVNVILSFKTQDSLASKLRITFEAQNNAVANVEIALLW